MDTGSSEPSQDVQGRCKGWSGPACLHRRFTITAAMSNVFMPPALVRGSTIFAKSLNFVSPDEATTNDRLAREPVPVHVFQDENLFVNGCLDCLLRSRRFDYFFQA